MLCFQEMKETTWQLQSLIGGFLQMDLEVKDLWDVGAMEEQKEAKCLSVLSRAL